MTGAGVRSATRLVPAWLHPRLMLTRLVQRRTRGRVRAGPFADMRYVDLAHGSVLIPKLLGTYERELAPVVEAIVRQGPDVVIDIGAAEGYYAVGLARRLPDASIIAFEESDAGRELLHTLSALNGVSDRVEVRGRCETSDLAAALSSAAGSVTILCDVEGYERTLLDPSAIPALERLDILVEVHDFIDPAISGVLRQRFESTHDIELTASEPRSAADLPWRPVWTRLLPPRYLHWATRERPVPMSWLWMATKDSGKP